MERSNVPLKAVVAGGVLGASRRVAALEKAVAAYSSGKGHGKGGTMVVMFFTDRETIASVQVYGREFAQSAESDSNGRQEAMRRAMAGEYPSVRAKSTRTLRYNQRPQPFIQGSLQTSHCARPPTWHPKEVLGRQPVQRYPNRPWRPCQFFFFGMEVVDPRVSTSCGPVPSRNNRRQARIQHSVQFELENSMTKERVEVVDGL